MFVFALVFAVLGVLIYKGNTNLINCYHEDRVTDRTTYSKKFGRALFVMAAVLVGSGIVGLFGEKDTFVFAALGVLVVGAAVGLGVIFHVQKKYGGGVF